MTIKLVLSEPKTGKTKQKELSEEESEALFQKKINDKISGDKLGLEGYELLITGGSDYCGFPMRRDVDGVLRKRILAVQGVGLKKKDNGIRIRKTVAGNTIYEKTAQVNVKVLKIGKENIFEEKPKEEEKQDGQ